MELEATTPDGYIEMNVFERSQVKARIGWQSLTTREYLDSGKYGLVGGINLIEGRIDWDSIPYVSKWRYDQDKFIQLHPNDLLISKDGTIGKIAFVNSLPVTSTLNSGVYVVRPKDGAYEPSFMYHLLNSVIFEDFIEKLSAGSTISHLYQKDLKHFVVRIPSSLREQKAIAEVLRDTDDLIDRTQNLIKKKVSLLSGIKFKIFRETNDWKSEKLGDLARIYQPETISAKHFTNFGYPVYGANGIVGLYEKFNHSTWQTLITCRGSTCGTINKTSDYVWITGNAMVVNIDDNKSLNKKFFYHLISVQDFSKCITGTGQPQIVRRPLEAFQVNFPEDIKEQERISLLLDDMDDEITLLEGELGKLLNLKQAVLNDLLTGKVRLV